MISVPALRVNEKTTRLGKTHIRKNRQDTIVPKEVDVFQTNQQPKWVLDQIMVQLRKDDRKGLSQTDFAQSAAHIEMHLNHLR